MLCNEEYMTQFPFPKYAYRKKQKHERSIRQLRQRCEGSKDCENKLGVDYVACIRNCMSPQCYQQLYSFNELEEGEVDVRYNSFKGCLTENSSI